MMKMMKMELPEALRVQVVSMAEQGASHEALVSRMRSAGLQKPQSIRLLSIATNISLGEAKRIVHFSPVWDDRRASDDAFHETAMQALEEWQHEGDHFDEHSPERLAS